MATKRNQTLERGIVDCISSMMALPPSFWQNMPTAATSPSRHHMNSEANWAICVALGNGERGTCENWSTVLSHKEQESFHQLNPVFARTKDVSFYDTEKERYNKHLVWAIDGNLYRVSTVHAVNMPMCHAYWNLETLHKGSWCECDSPYAPIHELRERWNADLKKLENVWNRLRKSARVKAGLDPEPGSDTKAKEAKKLAEITNAKMECALKAAELQDELQAFIAAIASDTMTQERIRDIFYTMQELGENNKNLKKVSGKRMPKA